jgi:hypothetical protein
MPRTDKPAFSAPPSLTCEVPSVGELEVRSASGTVSIQLELNVGDARREA